MQRWRFVSVSFEVFFARICYTPFTIALHQKALFLCRLISMNDFA